MAADANVQVNVKATADLQGLKDIKAQIEALAASGNLTKQKLDEMGVSIGTVGGKMGYVTSQGQLLTKAIADASKETQKAAKETESWGINTSKAIGETQVLVRELVTGSFHARTLGSLLSAFPIGITAAGIAAIALFELIKNSAESAFKLNEEFIKGREAIDKLAEGWERMARAVSTSIEMAALTHSMADAVRDLDEKIGELTRKAAAVTALRRELEKLFNPDTSNVPQLGLFQDPVLVFIGKLLSPEVDKQLKDAEARRVLLIDDATKSIVAGQKAQDDALSVTPLMQDRIESLTGVYNELRAKLEALDPASKTFEQDSHNIGNAIGQITDRLQNVRVEPLFDKLGMLIRKQGELDESSKTFIHDYDAFQDQIGVVTKQIDAAYASQHVYRTELEATRAEMDKLVHAGNERLQLDVDTQRHQELLNESLTPTREQQEKIIAQIADLKQKQIEVGQSTEDARRQFNQWAADIKILEEALKIISNQINTVTENIAKLNAETARQVEKGNTGLQAALDLSKRIEAEADVRNAKGNEELEISKKVDLEKLKVRQQYEAINKAAGATVVTEEEIANHVEIAGESERHRLEVIAGTGTAQSTLNAEMKDYETILQNIRQQQTVLKDQAFIGVDAQNVQMLRLYRQEIVNVINAMQQQQARKATLTDPAEIARANQELQKFGAQYQVLAAKIVTTTHQFQAGLQSWANSFGSTGQQLATTLQQTVGAALQSFNQWVVTGKFNLQALLQNVIQLGLQLVEQLLIQRAVGLINASLAETQAVASAQIIAAAWAGAATAVTTATEGQAAYGAPAALAIGLAGVKGVLGIGSLHEGGPVQRMHSGGLAHDEVPIIAQEGEIMIRRSVAQRDGMADFLLGLNAGEFHDGGFVAGGRYHRGSGMDVGSNVFGPESPFGKWGGPDFSGFSNYDPTSARMMMMLSGGGFMGPVGSNWFMQGPTMIPTSIGTSGYPRAVALGPGTDTNVLGLSHHTPPKLAKHSGGAISRFHSGGGVGGGGGGGVHIYAFTDLKALTRHMASRDGQKIIFDTVKGRRIDLGIS